MNMEVMLVMHQLEARMKAMESSKPRDLEVGYVSEEEEESQEE